MLAPTLVEIGLSGYTGRAGDVIKVVAEEGEIGAAEVQVVIADQAKSIVTP